MAAETELLAKSSIFCEMAIQLIKYFRQVLKIEPIKLAPSPSSSAQHSSKTKNFILDRSFCTVRRTRSEIINKHDF